MLRKWFQRFLALALLAALFSLVSVDEILRAFREVTLWNLFLLAAISVVMIYASALKWRLFARASGGEDVRLGTLMKFYTMAYFFNLFFPSAIGGDIVRSYQLGSHLKSQRDGFVATFFERFTGLMTMAAITVFFVCFGSPVTAGIETAVLVLGVAVACGSLICFSERISTWTFLAIRRVVAVAPLPANERLLRIAGKFDEGFRAMRRDRSLLWKALGYSFVFHVLTILNTKFAADAIGWNDADVGGLFIVVPLVLLISIVPLTPNAIGVQEGAFLFFLERIGATRPEALAVGLILRAKVTIIGLIGGILWLVEKRRLQAETRSS